MDQPAFKSALSNAVTLVGAAAKLEKQFGWTRLAFILIRMSLSRCQDRTQLQNSVQVGRSAVLLAAALIVAYTIPCTMLVDLGSPPGKMVLVSKAVST